MKNAELSAADAVWVATALLHQEHPRKSAFPVPDIVKRVQNDHLTLRLPMTIYLHANQHCVANRPPKNARLRMLIETADGLRRLYHDGDPVDPRRTGARSLPNPKQLPTRFSDLLRWYEGWNRRHSATVSTADPLLALAGTWTFGDADDYVRDLRQGWD